ncbi:hypothetical protein RRG08_011215 [Elysia crispata]|uniref:Tectonin beta-propeller repeat-containing protein 1 n=1 Tax=Elysia crispata TaxID=231223 RepID=A0AAE0XQH1_9GAST|nr:hypothetical protein RRG08_011215 [Elysia crispata]
MSESFLWLVNHIGDTFSLGTTHRLFRQLIYADDDIIAIKRVAASHWCAWAVGHDHRPYLFVLSSDVPIRIPETTFENQRWTPFYGFSKKSMIPSDRYAWSDESGTVERPKESVRLPSSHWEWDGDWMIDDNLRGEVVELGGWQYAIDFPAVYTPEQHWNSFVRRRKWIHFRRFFATDRWANISDMEMVEKLECFIDISVGGFLLPSQPEGFLTVWAVMNSGSVYVRTNVHRENPEGSTWCSISLEKHHGIINISVGATNLVWAVTWDGQGLVRTNVSRNNVYGSSWVDVESPDNTTQLMQVAVGRNAVWALSRDNKVWFRKGTWGDNTFWNEESAVGTLWVEMVGEMSQIALSSNDQVFAVDISGQNVYFRTGVSSHDLTGKTWQKVILREDLSQFKDLGLLSDDRLCSCTLDDEEFCEMHCLRRAPSESTSCSSISLSTATSSSANINEDVSGNGDVFMTPLSPSQPADMLHMLSMEDYLPPAWSLGEWLEKEEPITPTITQTAESSASKESNFGSLCQPVEETVQTSDTQLESKQKNGRVRSVSQYSLTDSFPNSGQSLTDSLPQSSRTASPVSSTCTVHVGLTRSVSSQTDSNSAELSSSQQYSTFSDDANIDFHPSSSATSEDTHNSRGDSLGLENVSLFSDGSEICDTNEKCDEDKKEVDKSSKFLHANLDTAPLNDHNKDLTEVDNHFKIFAESKASKEMEATVTEMINDITESDFENLKPIDHSKDAAVKTNKGKTLPSSTLSSELKIEDTTVTTKLGSGYPEPVTSENGKFPVENSKQDSLEFFTSLDAERHGEVLDAGKELGKRRHSKSHRRSSRFRKSDPSDDYESIVFKPTRRKKEKNNKKNSNNAQIVKNNSDSVSISSTGETFCSVSPIEAHKLNTSQVPDVPAMHNDDSLHNVIPQKVPANVTDFPDDLAPLALHKSSIVAKESAKKLSDALANENQLDNTETTLKLEANETKNFEKSFDDALPMCNNSSPEKVSLQQFTQENISQNNTKLDLKQESSDSNICDRNILIPRTVNSSDKNFVQTQESKGNVKPSHLNDDLISQDKCAKYSSISVSCQTEDVEISVSLKKSPKWGQRRVLKKDDSSKWCPMTKLTPAKKKSVDVAVASTKDDRDNTKDSNSESDEIVDFVTDLLSDEDSETEHQDEQDVEAVKAEEEDESREEPKMEEMSDSSSRLSLDSSHVEQSFRAASVTSMSSQSSSIKGRLSAPRRSSGAIRNSPSVPISLEFRQSALHRHTPSPARLNSPSIVDLKQMPDNLPGQTMVVAQPRLSWKWLDVTSCIIDDPSKVEWLSSREEGHETKAKIKKDLRDRLLQKIISRNKHEVGAFMSLETAVEKSTWVHKASMHMYQHGRRSRWIECRVELEQGIGAREKGTLTVHYNHRRKQMHTQIQLSDMICVKMNTDPDLSTVFNVFTPALNQSDQPLMLKATSEKEAAEWLDHLSSARAGAWNLNRPIPQGAVWSCSFTGDILVSPTLQDCAKPYLRSWGLHGGHMALIETSPSGVTWGLGFDRTPHVYNGGYGGAVCTGQSDMSYNTKQMIDSHRVYVYENQKWFPLVAWCDKGVFNHNFHWVTSSGQFVTSRDQVKLPSSKWHWISDWTIDFSMVGGVDSNGWQYSNHNNGSFHPRSHIRDHYRRRRWIRRCRLSMMGPWISAGSLSISDLSIQIDPVENSSDPIVMWAVAANGDVLCRYGVTQSNPLGHSWVHISRDQDKPFTSISVGNRGQVWGVATDGSAWFRTGVSPENPAGKHWLQVVPPPPGNFHLRQVSAGALSVWAVDTGDNLWRRENITPTFPEGTGWESMANKVKRVSVGPQDQVWIVADAYFQKSRHAPGVIYHRQGISDKYPGGTGWQKVIGSGWAHVSVRGVTTNLGNADSGIEES